MRCEREGLASITPCRCPDASVDRCLVTCGSRFVAAETEVRLPAPRLHRAGWGQYKAKKEDEETAGYPAGAVSSSHCAQEPSPVPRRYQPDFLLLGVVLAATTRHLVPAFRAAQNVMWPRCRICRSPCSGLTCCTPPIPPRLAPPSRARLSGGSGKGSGLVVGTGQGLLEIAARRLLLNTRGAHCPPSSNSAFPDSCPLAVRGTTCNGPPAETSRCTPPRALQLVRTEPADGLQAAAALPPIDAALRSTLCRRWHSLGAGLRPTKL